MVASVDEKSVGAGAQPARAPLQDEIGETVAAFHAHRLLEQRVELGAALRGNADRLGERQHRRGVAAIGELDGAGKVAAGVLK